LSKRTLEDKRVDGTGPPFFKMGHGKRARVVYQVADLDVWLAQFRRTSTTEEKTEPDSADDSP
jgi:hypothetical protein